MSDLGVDLVLMMEVVGFFFLFFSRLLPARSSSHGTSTGLLPGQASTWRRGLSEGMVSVLVSSSSLFFSHAFYFRNFMLL